MSAPHVAVPPPWRRHAERVLFRLGLLALLLVAADHVWDLAGRVTAGRVLEALATAGFALRVGKGVLLAGTGRR